MPRRILLMIALALWPVGCAQQSSSSGYSRSAARQSVIPEYVSAYELAPAKSYAGFYPGLTALSEREASGGKYSAERLNELQIEKSSLEAYQSRNADDIAKIEVAWKRYRNGEPFAGCIGAKIHECVAGLAARQLVSTSHVGDLIRQPQRDIVGASGGGNVMFIGTVYPISDTRVGREAFARSKIEVTIYADENGPVRSLSFSFEDGGLTSARTETEFEATRVHELFMAVAGTSCSIGAKDFYVAVYTDLLKNGQGGPDRFYNSLDSISRVRTTNYHAKRPICGLSLSYDIWEQRSASTTSYGQTDRFKLWLKGVAAPPSRGSASVGRGKKEGL